MEKIQTDKTQNIKDIFQEYAGQMLLYAQSLMCDFQAAEDLIQEIFISLISSNTLPIKPKNYLLRSVRNRVLNQRRGLKLQNLDGFQESDAIFTHPLEKKEEREQLSKAVMQLPQEQREVVVLKIWEELTFNEIAEMVDASLNTVTSRYRYALEKLKTAMNDYYKG